MKTKENYIYVLRSERWNRFEENGKKINLISSFDKNTIIKYVKDHWNDYFCMNYGYRDCKSNEYNYDEDSDCFTICEGRYCESYLWISRVEFI